MGIRKDKKGKAYVMIYLPEELEQTLQTRAKELNLTISSYCRMVLTEALRKREKIEA